MGGKKEKLFNHISAFVYNVLNKAEKEDKLDYINIEITNHNGNLQMDYTIRDRGKAY
ncbi:MAG TPA: hypothetical protein GXX35_11405 [Thermoanaerobacterales bacterium]|nr:hypothetical protein [Thermoanaerobacterales bacterium]